MQLIGSLNRLLYLLALGAEDLFYNIKLNKKGGNMLGFAGVSIFLAYILCLISTVFCIVYGAIMWNKDK